MTYYFNLQLRIAKRRLRAFGIHPTLAVILAVIAFVAMSYVLFQRTSLAPYIMFFAGIGISKSWDNIDKIDFLKLNYSNKQLFIIRLLEHFGLAFPFILALAITTHWWYALILFLIIPALTRIIINTRSMLKIPSPYQKFPFEFTVGFRTFFPFILLAYLIGITGCIVGNYNIAVFALMLLGFGMMNYYSLPEPSLIIWEDVRSERQLLHYKLLVGARYFVLTSLPLVVMMIVIYPQNWAFSLLWISIVIIYFLFFILMKYDAYPDRMNLPHTIYFISCLIIPPLVLFFGYRFYNNALHNIKINLR